MNLMNRSINPIVIGLFILLSACATKDLHLGDDVKSMQREQVYNDNAAISPVSDPVPQDGQKAQVVIDKYRGLDKQKNANKNAALTIAN